MIEFVLSGPLSASIISTIIIISILSLVFIIVGIKVSKMEPEETPKGFIFICISIVDFFNAFLKDYVKGKKFDFFAPYFFTIIIFLAFANTIALFGLNPPLGNIGVALSFSVLTFFMIKVAEFKFQGVWNKVKGLVGPVWWLFPISIPTNLIGEVSTPFSMGLRLFVNLLSGIIISTMIFAGLHWVFSIFVGTLLHAIFDIFFGLIQAFVFFMLSVITISMASES